MPDARLRQPPDLIPGAVQTLKQIGLLMRGHGPAFAPISRVESAGLDRARAVQREVASPGAAWTIKRVRTFASAQFVRARIEPDWQRRFVSGEHRPAGGGDIDRERLAEKPAVGSQPAGFRHRVAKTE